MIKKILIGFLDLVLQTAVLDLYNQNLTIQNKAVAN